MSYIIFENPGEIDVRMMTSFGVSVKETENPIGFFGTGMKYALAILMRFGHKVVVQVGEEDYFIGIKKTEIRGKEFNFVTLDEQELSFTTELGKRWELWMAFRELVCNCKDEGGSAFSSTTMPEPVKGVTRFIVWGAEFEKVWDERDSIMLNVDDRLMRSSTTECVAYERESNAIFYRGVKVMELETPSKLTYNLIGKLDLTEDRTVAHPHLAEVSAMRAVARLKDKRIIIDLLTQKANESYEGSLNFLALQWWTGKPSEEFSQVVEQEFKRNNDRLNLSAREYFKTFAQEKASKHYEPADLNEVEKKQLDKCVSVLSTLFRDFEEYKVLVVKTLGSQTMGLADRAESTMIISRDAFVLGTKFLFSTMLEEYSHLRTGYSDFSRPLQTWTYDQFCSLVENYVTKEPI